MALSYNFTDIHSFVNYVFSFPCEYKGLALKRPNTVKSPFTPCQHISYRRLHTHADTHSQVIWTKKETDTRTQRRYRSAAAEN